MTEDSNKHDQHAKFLAYLIDRTGSSDLRFASPPKQLHGGFETLSYQFQLVGASGDLAGPQVLRLYPAFYGAGNAEWASTVQNALADIGYPAARARLLCTDLSVLGGAFFVMDYIPGRPLAMAPPELIPELLGTTHAELHEIDPAPLIATLDRLGVDRRAYGPASRYAWLSAKGEAHPWVGPAVDWLLEHRPSDPERLSVCHGDFHPFNVQYADGRVTGVLDWPGLTIGDPAFDVGNTMVLIMIAAGHLFGAEAGLGSIDWELMVRRYLQAYRSCRDLDGANLDFFRVRRCVAALVQGAEGQRAWQQPLVVRDLLEAIRDVTGVQLDVPAQGPG